MKSPITRLPGLLALAILLPTQRTRAHTDPPKQIGLLVEYYEVEHSALPPLLRAYQKESGASGLLAKVQEMAENGEARLVESTYTVTRSGQRTKIESVREIVYPSKWDPADSPKKLSGPIDRDAVIGTPATPIVFSNQPVGNTLEFDPVVGPDGIIVEIDLAPYLVEYLGRKDWGHGLSATSAPLFHAMNVQTSITTKFGGCELFGVFTPSSNDGGKRVLGFISTLKRVATSPEIEKLVTESARKLLGESPSGETTSNPNDSDPFATEADASPGDSFPNSPSQISVILEYIDVEANLAARLIRELGEVTDATAIREDLDQVIAEGKAAVLETSSILTRSGQRAKTESTREFIYPTEVRTSRVPPEVHGPIGPLTNLTIPTSPSAFDMRPLGITLEVDPAIGWNGLAIDLNIAPELVRHVRDLTYGTGAATSERPLFETLKISTAVTVPDGSCFLLGMHSLETARAGEAGTEEERAAVRGRRVLVFVTAKVKKVE